MTSPTPPTIEIPMLAGERAERYEARVAYLTMGADRSLRDLARRLHKSLTLVGRWSVEDDWQAHARTYDQQLGALAARAHEEAYRRDLEAHRADAMKAAGELVALGRMLAAEVTRRRDTLDYRPSDLAVAVKAILTGMDIRAHALDLPRLLAALDGEAGEDTPR
jgi:hypothetical protein